MRASKLFLILAFLTSVSLADTSFAQNDSLITVNRVKQFCQVWFPALVRGHRQPQAAARELVETFYTTNAEMIDPNFSQAQVGAEALVQYYAIVLEKYPNWSFTIEDIFPTDKGFVLHYIGHVPGVVDSFRGVDIIELDSQFLQGAPEQWRIAKLIGIYDRTPFNIKR